MDGAGRAAPAHASAAALGDNAEFEHAALLYRGEAEYRAEVTAFVRSALARGERVLAAVPSSRAVWLREELGPDAHRVDFADMAAVGRNPGRIIPAVLAFIDAHPGVRVSVVGEPAWPGRSPAEQAETAKHEALCNLAFAGAPIAALCPYDACGLPPAVLAEAQQTHPLLAGGMSACASPAYLGPAGLPARCLAPLPGPPPGALALLYRADLRPVRALTGRAAVEAGLPSDRATDLVIAVSELAANTLRHTAEPGALRIWRTADELVCEISDQGWIADPLAGRRSPDGDAAGGKGLWLVNQVCDLVELRTSPGGTVIRLHMDQHG